MALSRKQLAYQKLAKKSPAAQSFVTKLFTPGLLNTDGTPATGGVPKVISTPARETFATVSNANVQRFETLLNDLAKADPRQAASTVFSTPASTRSAISFSQPGVSFSSALQGKTTQQSTQEPFAFEKDLDLIRGASDISAETKQELLDARLEKEFGGGMSAAELQDFETLVGRLEGSKMRQADQLNRARQREKYSGGLASMMRNF
jgi:hypothetical protein